MSVGGWAVDGRAMGGRCVLFTDMKRVGGSPWAVDPWAGGLPWAGGMPYLQTRSE
jgi:hypothetical protein